MLYFFGVVWTVRWPRRLSESYGNVFIVCFAWKVRQATLIRVGGKTDATIKVKAGATLDILVENMGRINYGLHLQDPKGILGDVILDNVVLRNWKIYPLHLDQVVGVKKSPPAAVKNDEASIQIPTFYTGNIPPAPDGIPKDTFLNLPGWFKVKRRLCKNTFKSKILCLDFLQPIAHF